MQAARDGYSVPCSHDSGNDRLPHPSRRPGRGAGHRDQPLARRRHRRREGDPGLRQRLRAALLRRARVGRRSAPAAGRRPHVALRGGRQRGDRLGRDRRSLAARRGPRRPHRRARAREPGRAARRGSDRRPLSRDGAGPGVGHRDPGDLHAVRHRSRLRPRHPHAHRRRGPGHDRLPLRPGPGRRGRPRAPQPSTATPTSRSRRSSRTSPSRPTTSAASGAYM